MRNLDDIRLHCLVGDIAIYTSDFCPVLTKIPLSQYINTVTVYWKWRQLEAGLLTRICFTADGFVEQLVCLSCLIVLIIKLCHFPAYVYIWDQHLHCANSCGCQFHCGDNQWVLSPCCCRVSYPEWWGQCPGHRRHGRMVLHLENDKIFIHPLVLPVKLWCIHVITAIFLSHTC